MKLSNNDGSELTGRLTRELLEQWPRAQLSQRSCINRPSPTEATTQGGPDRCRRRWV